MSFLFGLTCIVAIFFMLSIIFIGIWLLITAIKTFGQIKYKNYILEKIQQNLEKNEKKI